MEPSRLRERLLTVWIREPRPKFGQEMSNSRWLERFLKLFGRNTDLATLAQERDEWARLFTRKRPH